MDEFLTSVELPETLTYIGENAFSGCSNLGPLTIPAGVTEISSNAFSSMGAVRNWGDTIDWCTVIFEGDAPVFAKDAFYRSCLRVYYDAKNETWDGVVNHSFGSTRDAWMGGSCGNGGAVKWMVTPDGTLTIFGSGAMLGYFSYSGSGYDNYSLDFRPWDRHPGDIHELSSDLADEYIGRDIDIASAIVNL